MKRAWYLVRKAPVSTDSASHNHTVAVDLTARDTGMSTALMATGVRAVRGWAGLGRSEDQFPEIDLSEANCSQ